MKQFTIRRNAAQWQATVLNQRVMECKEMNDPEMFYKSHNDGYVEVVVTIQDAHKMSLNNAKIMLPICNRSHGIWTYDIVPVLY